MTNAQCRGLRIQTLKPITFAIIRFSKNQSYVWNWHLQNAESEIVFNWVVLEKLILRLLSENLQTKKYMDTKVHQFHSVN